MRRAALVLAFLIVGSLLPGCPIYGSDEGCADDSDCPLNYVCDGLTGVCSSQSKLSCNSPSECAPNETCSQDGYCRIGDCSWADIGCVGGYRCSQENGVWACVAASSGAGGGGGTGGAGATGGTAGTSSGGTAAASGAAGTPGAGQGGSAGSAGASGAGGESGEAGAAGGGASGAGGSG
jgi:hypothetical protein